MHCLSIQHKINPVFFKDCTMAAPNVSMLKDLFWPPFFIPPSHKRWHQIYLSIIHVIDTISTNLQNLRKKIKKTQSWPFYAAYLAPLFLFVKHFHR